MDELVKCLGQAFAVGFGVQRLLEVIDGIFGGFPKLGDKKKLVMVIASVVLATALSFGGIRVLRCLPSQDLSNEKNGTSNATAADKSSSLTGLSGTVPSTEKSNATTSTSNSGNSTAGNSTPKTPQPHVPDWVDQIVTILFISGGTEGFNALLKFLNYKKEDAKASAASSQSDTASKKIGGKDALSVVGGT